MLSMEFRCVFDMALGGNGGFLCCFCCSLLWLFENDGGDELENVGIHSVEDEESWVWLLVKSSSL
jgi:hypothetical protein